MKEQNSRVKAYERARKLPKFVLKCKAALKLSFIPLRLGLLKR
jgi:hypothetical protein